MLISEGEMKGVINIHQEISKIKPPNINCYQSIRLQWSSMLPSFTSLHPKRDSKIHYVYWLIIASVCCVAVSVLNNANPDTFAMTHGWSNLPDLETYQLSINTQLFTNPRMFFVLLIIYVENWNVLII